MARLYRQAPLNAIWEGSGNVIALDILRALQKEPNAARALLTELSACKGADGRLDVLIEDLKATLQQGGGDADAGAMVARARLLVDKMAIALQAATLIRYGHEAAAEGYCASRLPRLGGDANDDVLTAGGWNYGAMSPDFGRGASGRELVDRLVPAV